MAIVCSACGAWTKPVVDHEEKTACCTECGHIEPRRFGPLFIVTGASGVGKTAVVPELQRLLPDWDVFETDILWDSGGDWSMVKCNWLRIAHSLMQSRRPVILCGSIKPADLNQCETRPFFTTIYYLALHCEDTTLAERLRARSAWRGWTEELVAKHQEFQQWFLDHATSEFEPPLALVDTTSISVEESACRIRDWALGRWHLEQG